MYCIFTPLPNKDPVIFLHIISNVRSHYVVFKVVLALALELTVTLSFALLFALALVLALWGDLL